MKLGMIYMFAALAEITGCYLTFIVLREHKSAWLLIPAVFSLCAFAWLLSLPSGPAGRTYAAYGGIYVVAAVVWMWKAEGVLPDRWDLVGAAISIFGMGVIAFGPRGG